MSRSHSTARQKAMTSRWEGGGRGGGEKEGGGRRGEERGDVRDVARIVVSVGRTTSEQDDGQIDRSSNGF